MIALKILASMREKGRRADFVLCIGDNRPQDTGINEGERAMSRFRPVHRRRSLRRGHVRGADCVDQGQKNERERRGK